MPYKIKHGASGSKTYRIWAGIKHRCNSAHPYYGGRGIRLCERWQTFANFLEDIGEIPDGMSVDRMDSKGHYEPGNVQLVDAKGQARNRSNNRFITINGVTKTMAGWQEEYDLPANTILNRIYAGRSGQDLIAPSCHFRDRKLTFKGISMNVAQWAQHLGINKTTLCGRLQRGWSLERALTTKGDSRHNPMRKGSSRQRSQKGSSGQMSLF